MRGTSSHELHCRLLATKYIINYSHLLRGFHTRDGYEVFSWPYLDSNGRTATNLSRLHHFGGANKEIRKCLIWLLQMARIPKTEDFLISNVVVQAV